MISINLLLLLLIPLLSGRCCSHTPPPVGRRGSAALPSCFDRPSRTHKGRLIKQNDNTCEQHRPNGNDINTAATVDRSGWLDISTMAPRLDSSFIQLTLSHESAKRNLSELLRVSQSLSLALIDMYFRGNHLSNTNTTCLAQVFLKSGEQCS